MTTGLRHAATRHLIFFPYSQPFPVPHFLIRLYCVSLGVLHKVSFVVFFFFFKHDFLAQISALASGNINRHPSSFETPRLHLYRVQNFVDLPLANRQDRSQ